MDVMIRGGYENIYFTCPSCGEENIYNRVSDLKTIHPITRLDNIKCNSCSYVFSIWCDKVVSAKRKWFIGKLENYKSEKKYMAYILDLCQGCETFFSQAIINKLVDRNIDVQNKMINWNDKKNELNKTLITDLSGKNNSSNKKFEDAPFHQLKEIFLHQFDEEKDEDNGRLSKMSKDKRQQYFNCIKDTDINKIRNAVIHKTAYRPTLKEVQKYGELKDALFWLGKYLNVKDSVLVVNYE